MNCLDFRREAQAQPLRLVAEAQAHADTCEACRAFLEHQRAVDAELYEALRVPAPDGLADRILVAHGIRRRRAPWAWALAATLVLAVGVATLAPPAYHGHALADEAIEHVMEEPQSFRIVARHADGYLPAELAAQGIRLARRMGEVTYATLCPMSAGKARHVVVATAEGPVTLLLMPSDTTHRRRTMVEGRGMFAIALPAARGSIAIVASSRAQALAAEAALVIT